MARHRKTKFKNNTSGATLGDGVQLTKDQTLDIKVESEPADTGGFGARRSGMFIRVFSKIAGVPFQQIIPTPGTADFNALATETDPGGGRQSSKVLSFTPALPGGHSIRVIAWDRKNGGELKKAQDVHSHKIRIKVV